MNLNTKTKPKAKQKKHVAITEYRYNIKRRLSNYSASQKSRIMHHVQQETQIGLRTIYNVINEEKGNFKHNNINILLAFARVFNCAIDDLINR